MGESAKGVAERAVAAYNDQFRPGQTTVTEASRAVFAPAPVIVPFRAALEGTAYSGQSALDDFFAETRESWAWLRLEVAQIREVDADRALVLGELVGSGIETGAETSAPVALLFVVAAGKVTEARTYASEAEALTAVNA
jgi:ketosteroid isomerase-like protein